MTQFAAPAKTNTLALIGFIAAFVIPIAGPVLGILACRQLSIPGNPETGNGVARWADFIGALGTLFQFVFLIVRLSLSINAIKTAPLVG